MSPRLDADLIAVLLLHTHVSRGRRVVAYEHHVEADGNAASLQFRDAPGGRGTIVEAVIAYKPPMGALGQAVAKLFSAEPSVQARRDLKRLKMLLETGEIATSANRRSDGGKFQQSEAVQRDMQANTATA